ncbi:MAG: hypothetical protein OIF34_09375, partial [Porticoccaceae bacterium]|nr:hypothetical protein [Porticoccaceae bacterium]
PTPSKSQNGMTSFRVARQPLPSEPPEYNYCNFKNAFCGQLYQLYSIETKPSKSENYSKKYHNIKTD